jgi:membrane protein DedA with SNARE-associated domain
MSAITQFLIVHGGLILFLIGFAEQSGLPIPGAPWLLAAGALAASGRLSLIGAICWAAAGCMAADAIWLYVGKRGRGRILRVFSRFEGAGSTIYLGTRTVSIRRGAWLLTTAKFLPFGNLVPLRAGALEVGPLRFFLVDVFSSVFYATVYVFLGFIFHKQLEQVVAFLRKLSGGTLLLIVILAGAYVVYRFLKRSPKSGTDIIQNGAVVVEETHVLHTHNYRTVPSHCFSGGLRPPGRGQKLNVEPPGSELPV